MNDTSVFARFRVVDTLRNPTNRGPTDQEKEVLLGAVRSLPVDIKVIHSVTINYLSSMKASSEEVSRAIVEMLQKNKSFEQAVFQAVREAIVFSTLAGVLLPEAYRLALTAMTPLRWPQVHKMRKTLFAIGIEMLLEEAAEDRIKGPVVRINAEAFLSR